MKRRMLVIGIGAGNPEYITVQAINALNRASVLFIPNKGADKSDLHRLRRDICERFIEGSDYRLVDFDVPERSKAGAYSTDVADWRAAVQSTYERLLSDEIGEDEIGAFLVWGDPSLYDGTMGILDAIRSSGKFDLEFDVIPGISSVSALAARHKVALNRIGEPLTITTGRQVSKRLPDTGGNVVVMLDTRDAFASVTEDMDIHWGAYVGTEDEILIAGRLSEVRDEISRCIAEVRDEKGWVMDTYLLSRRGDGDSD